MIIIYAWRTDNLVPRLFHTASDGVRKAGNSVLIGVFICVAHFRLMASLCLLHL